MGRRGHLVQDIRLGRPRRFLRCSCSWRATADTDEGLRAAFSAHRREAPPEADPPPPPERVGLAYATVVERERGW